MADVSQSPEEIVESIENGREDQIVGAYEMQSVDFKGQYRLSEASEKWELAKDLAALANSGGGLIAIGFTTEIDPDRAEERVIEVNPVPAGLFDPKQVYDIAQVWVYPPPNITAIRYPRDDGVLGTIVVRTESDDEPYLVTRMPDEAGKLVGQVAVGWPRRNGTHTAWTPVGQIHRHLRPPPDSTSAPMNPAPAVLPHPVQPKDLVDELDRTMGWTDRAILYLVARPSEPVPVPLAGFYSSDGVLGAIERPFSLRYAGFGLTYGHQVETDEDGRIISSDDQRALILRPDGIAIAALSAAPHYLTRGGGSNDPAAPEQRRINPVVVTEWTYLFCYLVANHLAGPTKSVWQLLIGLRGAKNRPWSVAAVSGRPDASQMWFSDAEPSRLDNWEHWIDATLDPGVDSYRLLTALYEIFGLKYETVGLSTNDRVDPTLISALS